MSGVAVGDECYDRGSTFGLKRFLNAAEFLKFVGNRPINLFSLIFVVYTWIGRPGYSSGASLVFHQNTVFGRGLELRSCGIA